MTEIVKAFWDATRKMFWCMHNTIAPKHGKKLSHLTPSSDVFGVLCYTQKNITRRERDFEDIQSRCGVFTNHTLWNCLPLSEHALLGRMARFLTSGLWFRNHTVQLVWHKNQSFWHRIMVFQIIFETQIFLRIAYATLFLFSQPPVFEGTKLKFIFVKTSPDQAVRFGGNQRLIDLKLSSSPNSWWLLNKALTSSTP